MTTVVLRAGKVGCREAGSPTIVELGSGEAPAWPGRSVLGGCALSPHVPLPVLGAGTVP